MTRVTGKRCRTLVLCWSLHEPHRLGETAALADSCVRRWTGAGGTSSADGSSSSAADAAKDRARDGSSCAALETCTANGGRGNVCGGVISGPHMLVVGELRADGFWLSDELVAEFLAGLGEAP